MLLAPISSDRSLPIVLRSREAYPIVMMLNNGLLAVCGAIAIASDPWLGLFSLLFFGAGFFILLSEVKKNPVSLRLDYGGFTLTSWRFERKIPWSAVSYFAIVKPSKYDRSLGPRRQSVGWKYVSKARAFKNSVLLDAAIAGQALNRRDVDSLLPRTFGRNPKALAALLNELRRCHAATERQLKQSAQR